MSAGWFGTASAYENVGWELDATTIASPAMRPLQSQAPCVKPGTAGPGNSDGPPTRNPNPCYRAASDDWQQHDWQQDDKGDGGCAVDHDQDFAAAGSLTKKPTQGIAVTVCAAVSHFFAPDIDADPPLRSHPRIHPLSSPVFCFRAFRMVSETLSWQ